MRSFALAALLVMCMAVSVVAAEGQWTKAGPVVVNGSPIPDTCYLKKGRSLVFPVLAIAEALGKKASVSGTTVEWEGRSKACTSLVVLDGVAYAGWRDLQALEPSLEYGVSGDKAIFALGARKTMPGSASADEGGDGAQWLESFGTAQTRAMAQNKRMLLDFTGSDWCGWCIKLDKEVFATPEFAAYAARNLILVKLDFPRGIAQPAELKKQNEELARKYNIEGFPTLVILAPDGKVLGTTGYQPGGPAVMIKELESIK